MELTIDNLIKLTSEGISVMDYSDIITTLSNRFKNIFGEDIDIDPRSGDGRIIYDVGTMVNTGNLVISQLYNYLNPSTATGYFLDIVSSLCNVDREPAKASQAKVRISNSTSNDVTITDLSTLGLKDDSGNIWTATTDDATQVQIPKNSYIDLVYTAPVTGKTTTSSLTFAISDSNTSNLTTEIEAFSIGSEKESDGDFRYRRASDATKGITVLEGIQGKVKNIFGIDDCYIYSYAGNTDETNYCYVDNNKVIMPLHSISVLLRYNSVNTPNKSKIAEVITDNITPGVSTNGTTTYYDLNPNTKIKTSVSWYIVNQIHPTISIVLTGLYNFAGLSTAKEISSDLVDYLNNLKINQSYNTANLTRVIENADPLYMSRSTYRVSSIEGLFDNDETLNKGCYFDYGSRADVDYSTTYDSNTNTITIKRL